MRFLSLLSTLLLVSCISTTSDNTAPPVITQTIIPYSDKFEDILGDELDALAVKEPPCNRLNPILPCSAMEQAIPDYGWDRCQGKAMLGQVQYCSAPAGMATGAPVTSGSAKNQSQ